MPRKPGRKADHVVRAEFEELKIQGTETKKIQCKACKQGIFDKRKTLVEHLAFHCEKLSGSRLSIRIHHFSVLSFSRLQNHLLKEEMEKMETL